VADLAVLSEDYFAVEEDAIRAIESVLTVVDGKIVYGSEAFKSHSPELPPVSPDWSPVNRFGGYDNSHHSGRNEVSAHLNHDHLPGHSHWIMCANGRAGQTGCGCSV
jgi:hypothetical protein